MTEGEALDTVAACPPLTILEQAKLRELHAKEAAAPRSRALPRPESFIARKPSNLSIVLAWM